MYTSMQLYANILSLQQPLFIKIIINIILKHKNKYFLFFILVAGAVLGLLNQNIF